MASEATATGQGPQTVEALAEEVAAQSALVNELRKQGAENAAVEEAKKKLGELKKSLALLQHAQGAGAKGEKKKERMLLKTPKVRCGCAFLWEGAPAHLEALIHIAYMHAYRT